jgi:pimeloyl-ACP methyl ester carboxylesterase
LKPVIVFSHANGFPAGTYNALFEPWREAGFEVLAPDKLGHNPAYGVASGWRRLRDELLDFINPNAAERQVHLVGHSLGGYLSLLAASRRPDIAASVVLLDSPVVGGWRAHSVRMVKLIGLMQRVGPGRVSAARRSHWPSEEAALQHFAAKPVFARWDPRVLRDYIACGTEPDPQGGVRLAFAREIETRLYNTLPHDLPKVLRKHPLQCRVTFIGGRQSVEVRQAGVASTRAITHGRLQWLEGSHLFPMERPLETAAAVLRAMTA